MAYFEGLLMLNSMELMIHLLQGEGVADSKKTNELIPIPRNWISPALSEFA